MAPCNASTNRDQFLVVPKRRECAKHVSEANSDFNRWFSWLLALESVSGSLTPLLALACSPWGRTMESAAVRCSRVLCSVVLACPKEMATSSTLPRYFLRAAIRNEYISVFSVSLVSYLRSLHNSTSTRTSVHRILLTLFRSGSRVDGIFLGVNEVWRCAVLVLEEFLGLVRRECPWWYLCGGLRTLRIPFGV